MQALPDPRSQSDNVLQLLLFVDQRPVAREQIRQVRELLKELGRDTPYDLQIIDVTEHPHLAEHFRLLTTPTLIKIAPEPRQMLVGGDFLAELRNCWLRWQQSNQTADVSEISDSVALKHISISDHPSAQSNTKPNGAYELASASELIKLSDEIFQLKQEKAELLTQIRFKDQVIAMLAHDLRNPLTAAAIAVETLDSGFHPKADQVSRLTPALITQLIRQARAQLQRINDMITDILQAAPGKSAELHIHPQPIDLSTLCYEVLETLGNRCQAKSITVETDIPTDLPKVYIDEERIRQVLINLMDNAIKYTSDGGKIQLIALHRTTQKVQVSLCDTGLGIPEDEQQKIFDEHVRLSRDQDKSGYGIGLYLCQKIVRAHYGRIWVDSVLGQGSCFHFTLPVHIQ